MSRHSSTYSGVSLSSWLLLQRYVVVSAILVSAFGVYAAVAMDGDGRGVFLALLAHAGFWSVMIGLRCAFAPKFEIGPRWMDLPSFRSAALVSVIAIAPAAVYINAKAAHEVFEGGHALSDILLLKSFGDAVDTVEIAPRPRFEWGGGLEKLAGDLDQALDNDRESLSRAESAALSLEEPTIRSALRRIFKGEPVAATLERALTERADVVRSRMRVLSGARSAVGGARSWEDLAPSLREQPAALALFQSDARGFDRLCVAPTASSQAMMVFCAAWRDSLRRGATAYFLSGGGVGLSRVPGDPTVFAGPFGLAALAGFALLMTASTRAMRLSASLGRVLVETTILAAAFAGFVYAAYVSFEMRGSETASVGAVAQSAAALFGGACGLVVATALGAAAATRAFTGRWPGGGLRAAFLCAAYALILIGAGTVLYAGSLWTFTLIIAPAALLVIGLMRWLDRRIIASNCRPSAR